VIRCSISNMTGAKKLMLEWSCSYFTR